MVTNSRNLLSEQLANLLPHSEEVKDALADAVAADAYVGKCPKCGKDLQIRVSQKTRGMFIGCAGWPDCDVTYPLPQYGAITATDEVCEHCGAPMVIVTTTRGPWKLCPNFSCPGKEIEAEKKAAAKEAKAAAKKAPAKKAAAKKPAAKKTTAKKAAAAKTEEPVE